jgi:hypothetical protein
LEPSSSGGDRLAEQAVNHIEHLILEPNNKFRKLLSEVDLPPEVRAIGLRRLAYLVSNAEANSSRGSYLNWITLLALRTLTIGPRNFPSIHLRNMLEALYTGGPLKSYEARLADMMESEDRLLFGVPGQGTGLSDKVVTEYTKLAIRNSPSHHSAHLRRIRMRHIFQSEKGDMAAAKLRELTDEHAELVGFRQRYDLLFPSNSVNGSQLNGYFDHSRLATLVTELMIQMPLLLETNGRRSRFEECQRRLTEFLKKRSSQEPLTESEIVAALETLGDPASIKMAKEIKDATNLLFSLRDHGQLMALIEEAYRKSLSDPSRSLSSRELETLKSRFANVSGMFFPPEVLLPGRAAIVIEPLDGEPTPQSLFHLLMGLRHEFAHFESIRSANTLIARTAAEEAFAYGSEARYGEWHGELTLLTRALDESPQGVGIYLRNFAESQPTNIYF